MHNTTDKYLLQIHPEGARSEEPVNDILTIKMENLLDKSTKGISYRGLHKCTGCDELSGSCDLIVDGDYITNSLAVHYLRWHRNDVPESEINKLFNLMVFPEVENKK